MPYIGSSPNFGAVESQTITTANGSTATFTLNQFVPDSDSIIVTVGNVVQEPTTAYSAVGTTITFTENVPNGDTIVIRYLGRSVDVPTTYTNINRFKFVATGGQNTFQNNDANGLELSYTAGNIDVFMNGVRLDESDFTASNGTSVVLVTNASASDEIIIIAYKSVLVSNGLDKSSGGTVSGTTVFSGQTTFSGNAYFSGGIFGDVSFDSGVLKIDAGNNRVGVNTNSPQDDFHVKGFGRIEAEAGNGPYIRYDNTANSGGVMWRAGSASGHTNWDIYNQTDNKFIATFHKDGFITTPLQPLFEVTSSTTQAISNSTLTKTTLWDTKVHDHNDDFDISTDQFTAPVAGTYLMTCTVTLSTMVAGAGIGIVWKKQSTGGSMNIFKHPYHQSTEINITHTLTATTIMTLAANDKIELHVFQGSGYSESLTNANVFSGSNSSSQNWQGFLIG